MSRSPLVRKASLTSVGSSSDAGACVLWKDKGTPSGRYVSTRWSMYFSCVSVTWLESEVMSTLRRSEIGPSSSTFHRADSAEVKSS
eukprot:3114309-Pleurochrysis_carterae.AAC.1